MNRPDPSTIVREDFNYLIATRGWYRFEAAVDEAMIQELRDDLARLYKTRLQTAVQNGVGDVILGTTHHLVGERTSFDRLLFSRFLVDYLNEYFGGDRYVLSAFNAVINEKPSGSYVGKIHRDVRSFSAPYRLMINIMVLLDDFTLDNGATYLLSGSHHVAEKPSDRLFFERADRAVGRAGDVFAFDSHLWHAAGANETDRPRRCLTIGYTRPFIKPQIDFYRQLNEEFKAELTDEQQQLLGFFARVPASVDEYYQRPENRSYRSDQR